MFNLGRTLRLLLDAGDAEADWRGTDRQLAVITKATEQRPSTATLRSTKRALAWRAATAQR